MRMRPTITPTAMSDRPGCRNARLVRWYVHPMKGRLTPAKVGRRAEPRWCACRCAWLMMANCVPRRCGRREWRSSSAHSCCCWKALSVARRGFCRQLAIEALIRSRPAWLPYRRRGGQAQCPQVEVGPFGDQDVASPTRGNRFGAPSPGGANLTAFSGAAAPLAAVPETSAEARWRPPDSPAGPVGRSAAASFVQRSSGPSLRWRRRPSRSNTVVNGRLPLFLSCWLNWAPPCRGQADRHAKGVAPEALPDRGGQSRPAGPAPRTRRCRRGACCRTFEVEAVFADASAGTGGPRKSPPARPVGNAVAAVVARRFTGCSKLLAPERQGRPTVAAVPCAPPRPPGARHAGGRGYPPDQDQHFGGGSCRRFGYA